MKLINKFSLSISLQIKCNQSVCIVCPIIWRTNQSERTKTILWENNNTNWKKKKKKDSTSDMSICHDFHFMNFFRSKTINRTKSNFQYSKSKRTKNTLQCWYVIRLLDKSINIITFHISYRTTMDSSTILSMFVIRIVLQRRWKTKFKI